MSLNDTPAEPLLVAGMRNRPSGEVRHLPLDGRGMTGTTTRGFLREFDEYVAATLAVQHRALCQYALIEERQQMPCTYTGVVYSPRDIPSGVTP